MHALLDIERDETSRFYPMYKPYSLEKHSGTEWFSLFHLPNDCTYNHILTNQDQIPVYTRYCRNIHFMWIIYLHIVRCPMWRRFIICILIYISIFHLPNDCTYNHILTNQDQIPVYTTHLFFSTTSYMPFLPASRRNLPL